MSKNNSALNSATETYLLGVLERAAAGRLKLQDAQAALATLEACKLFSDLSAHNETISVARDLIEKAEEVRREGEEQAARAIAELGALRAELAALRKPTKPPEKPNRRRQRASSK